MAKQKQVGRPSKFSEVLSDKIIERLSQGESLRAICRDADMPHVATVLRWVSQDKEFREHYARACEIRAEHLFDEMFEIADDLGGDSQRDRLRVDTRKWALSKMNPKKYGDKVQTAITGANGGPLAIVGALGTMTEDQIDELIAQLGGDAGDE